MRVLASRRNFVLFGNDGFFYGSGRYQLTMQIVSPASLYENYPSFVTVDEGEYLYGIFEEMRSLMRNQYHARFE